MDAGGGGAFGFGGGDVGVFFVGEDGGAVEGAGGGESFDGGGWLDGVGGEVGGVDDDEVDGGFGGGVFDVDVGDVAGAVNGLEGVEGEEGVEGIVSAGPGDGAAGKAEGFAF